MFFWRGSVLYECLRRHAESISTLSYNGRADTLRTGGYAVDRYRIAGRLVQGTYRFVLPYSHLTGLQSFDRIRSIGAPA